VGKTIALERWRTRWSEHTAPPDRHDRELEATFLESHWTYGALVHGVAADALRDALKGETRPGRRHALFLKLFAESVNALETLGAWGWAIRERRAFRLFLDGYLSYPRGAADDFYRCVLERDGDQTLVELLDLPSRQAIIRAMRDVAPELTARAVAGSLDSVPSHLAACGRLYLADDRFLVAHYNKAKHGVTILRLAEHTGGDADFQLIAPQLVRSQVDDGNWYHIARITVDEETVDITLSNIEVATTLISELSLLAFGMHRAGLLSVQPHG
jgi:hypothetical protein